MNTYRKNNKMKSKTIPRIEQKSKGISHSLFVLFFSNIFYSKPLTFMGFLIFSGTISLLIYDIDTYPLAIITLPLGAAMYLYGKFFTPEKHEGPYYRRNDLEERNEEYDSPVPAGEEIQQSGGFGEGSFLNGEYGGQR